MKKSILVIVSFLLSCVSLWAAYNQDTCLSSYSGKYSFPEGCPTRLAQINVSSDSDSSLIVTSDIGDAILIRQHSDTFSIATYGGMVIFFRDASSKITGVKVFIPAAAIHVEGIKEQEEVLAEEVKVKKS